MAVQTDITADDGWFIGEDKALPITIYQSDGTTLQNITAWALRFDLRLGATDGDLVVSKTTTAGIALTTPGSGLCTVTIDDTDTDNLEPGRYSWSLKRTDSGNETVLAYGGAVLLRSASR